MIVCKVCETPHKYKTDCPKCAKNENVIRMTKALGYIVDCVGDEQVIEFLMTPNKYLDDMPINLVKTEIGLDRLRVYCYQVAHGIYV